MPFYLITPVQRIPRYNLLLRDLIKQTKTDHPDYNSIQEALKHIGTVADDINKSVLKAEKARAMADLLKRGFHGLDVRSLTHSPFLFVHLEYLCYFELIVRLVELDGPASPPCPRWPSARQLQLYRVHVGASLQ